MRRLLPSTIACCAALLVSACGDGADGLPDELQVRRTMDSFGRSIQERDYRTICTRLISRRVVASLRRVGLPCEQALQRGFGGVREPKLTIGRIAVEKGRATAAVKTEARGQRPSSDVVELVREAGGWRIAELAGS